MFENNNIATAWFGGTKEGANDVGIWLSIKSKGAWGNPVKISVQDNIPHWNPVLYVDSTQKTWLFYKVGFEISSWYTMVTTSNDNGMTWTYPKKLVDNDVGGRGPVKNKIIILSNNNWLAPASDEQGQWTAFADISADEGSTWVKSSTVPISQENLSLGLIQPTLWESEKGQVHMLLRSNDGNIYRSDSLDYGESWSKAYKTGLPNNNSGIDLVRMASGVLALVYNPVNIDMGPRNPLKISLSYDNGINWTDGMVLECDNHEYSYPAVITKNDMLYVTYTWKREKIAYCEIKVK